MFISADRYQTLINLDHVQYIEYAEEMTNPCGVVWAYMENGEQQFIFSGDTDHVQTIMRALCAAIARGDQVFNFGIEHIK